MKKTAPILIVFLLICSFVSFNFVNAQEFTTSDNSYKLELDNNSLGDTNNSPRAVDSTNNYLLSDSLEVFDTGFGDTTGSGVGDYAMKTGLQPTFEANVSKVNVLSNTINGVLLYDRLLFSINPSNNPTAANGVLFAVQISTSSTFTTIQYVNPSTFQPDAVTNSNLSVYYAPCAQTTGAPDANRWDCGVAGGLVRYIQGLGPSTTYYVRIVAKNGDFTNSQPGPSSSATTSGPSIQFLLSSNNSSFGNINNASINTASPSTTVTATTNAFNGYTVSIKGTGDSSSSNSSLYSSSGSKAIFSNASGNLTAGTEGYGLQGSTVSSPPPTLDSNWVGSGSYAGQLLRSTQTLFSNTTSSLSTGDVVSISYKATVSAATPSRQDYKDTITYTMTASF